MQGWGAECCSGHFTCHPDAKVTLERPPKRLRENRGPKRAERSSREEAGESVVGRRRMHRMVALSTTERRPEKAKGEVIGGVAVCGPSA